MALNTGVCSPWATHTDVEGWSGCSGLADDADIDAALLAASSLLFQLSGRQYTGSCVDDVVRPGYRATGDPVRRRQWGLWGANNVFLPIWGDRGPGTFGSDQVYFVSEIDLIDLVSSVSEVKVDGAVVAQSKYELIDHRWLARIDGQMWPLYQDLAKDPNSDLNTFQVKYTHGVAPPPDGKFAAMEMACQLTLFWKGSDDCDLPEHVRQITRQGVQYMVIDPQTFLAQGRTGLFWVDLFLVAHNPEGLQEEATIVSPDIPAPYRRVGQ